MPRTKQEQQERRMCDCGQRMVAINYIKEGVTHYRSICSSCMKSLRKKKRISGYSLNTTCEKCGFKPRYKEQLSVYDTENNIPSMRYKTVCLNCEEELRHTKWTQGDLIADF